MSSVPLTTAIFSIRIAISLGSCDKSDFRPWRASMKVACGPNLRLPLLLQHAQKTT
jgi:hypothetical protein